MSYAHSSMMKAQLALQAGLALLYLILPWTPTAEASVAGLLLCTVGIPHGANDYLYRKEMGQQGIALFTLRYLGAMALYALLWWWLPMAALLLFFAISFHHFGQSNFESARWRHAPALLWGGYILIVPVLLHWEEAMGIFMQMMQPLSDTQMNEEEFITGSRAPWQYAGMALTGGAYLVALFFNESAHKPIYFLQFVLVSTWYLLTPLLFGFVVVFCLWHSLQSLRHQVQHQHAAHGWSTGRFVKAMLPFSAAALGGFAAYVWWRGFHIGEAFILLSLITLPHVLVMHKLHTIDGLDLATNKTAPISQDEG